MSSMLYNMFPLGASSFTLLRLLSKSHGVHGRSQTLGLATPSISPLTWIDSRV